MTDPNPASVLDTVKKVIGFTPDYTAFDLDLIMFINSAFGSLQQLGVGPKTGFAIIDNTLLWSDYTTEILLSGMVKSVVCMKARLAFDPPATSFAIEAIEDQIKQLEWRLNIAAEEITPPSDPFNPTDGSGDVITQAYWWDLTGLSDFPDEAAIGDLGIDLDSGNVWRKAA